MKLVSTTLTNNRADVIGAALAAIAPHVDECIVIDTGVTDTTMQIACAVVGPQKFRPVNFKWCDDFAAARNFAAQQAILAGADWQIQADTDETLHLPGLRDFLSRCGDLDIVMVPHATRSFGHPRCVNLRVGAPPMKWVEPVHECLTGYERIAKAPPEWHFACIKRPNENLTAKYKGYARILEKRTREQPRNARAWYYLGDTYSILKLNESALAAWDRRLRLQKECPSTSVMFEAGWAAWRAANLRLELGKPDEALKTCARGLLAYPHMTELAWLSGWISYQSGNVEQALYWANRALDLGPQERRGSFGYPPAQRQLPSDLKRWCEHQIASRQLATPG